MKIRDNAVSASDFRNQKPFLMFKRLDLRDNVVTKHVPFKTDFGGDFLLKRTLFRWDGRGETEQVEPVPVYPPEPALPTRLPVELDYTDLEQVVYCNVSSLTDDHDGTEIDPYSLTDLLAFIVTVDSDTTVYITGTVTAIDPLFQANGFQIDYVAWSPAVNGPPKITLQSLELEDDNKLYFNGVMFNFVDAIGDPDDFSPDHSICFVNCFLQALNISLRPGYVNDRACLGNTFNCPAGTFTTLPTSAGDIGCMSEMLTTNDPYANEYDISADNGTLYNQSQVAGGTNLLFIAAGDASQIHTAWNEIDMEHDYSLTITFKADDAAAGTVLQFGLFNGASMYYGLEALYNPAVGGTVETKAYTNGAINGIFLLENDFGTVHKLEYRKTGNTVRILIDNVPAGTWAYDDAGHGDVAVKKPLLNVSGDIGVNVTDITIGFLQVKSRTNQVIELRDTLLKAETIAGTYTGYYNVHSARTTLSATHNQYILCDNDLLADMTLPDFSGTAEDFLDLVLFSTLVSSNALPPDGKSEGYPGYNCGLWGYQRTSIGAQNFSYPDLRYVDLDLGAGFGGIGTAMDPFSFYDLHIFTSSAPEVPITFLVKGKYENGAIYDFFWTKAAINHIYRPWNRQLYGPWRLKSHYSFDQQGGIVKVYGGIFLFEDAFGASVDMSVDYANHGQPQFYDCQIKTSIYGTFGALPSYSAYGCTIDCNSYIQAGAGLLDCLMQVGNTMSGAGPVGSIKNVGYQCILNLIAPANFDNCSNMWEFFPVPDWDDIDPEAWLFTDMYAGLPEAVTAGSAPYAGYETGLFGIQRVGIGACYFYPQAYDQYVTAAEITVSLSKITSAHKLFVDIPPGLFSSPERGFDCQAVAAPLPVDDYLYNTLYKGTQRVSFKTYNWIVEDNSTIVIDVLKDPAGAAKPEFLDIIVEGYFLEGAKQS